MLNELEAVEAAVPGLTGRLEHDCIVIAGHSCGATSASALVGARVIDAHGTPSGPGADPRVKAAVLLALAGTGGADLTPFAADNFSFMSPDFAEMTTPSLVVVGDHDRSRLSVRGPDWWTDAFRLAPGTTDRVTLFGCEHYLGGV